LSADNWVTREGFDEVYDAHLPLSLDHLFNLFQALLAALQTPFGARIQEPMIHALEAELGRLQLFDEHLSDVRVVDLDRLRPAYLAPSQRLANVALVLVCDAVDVFGAVHSSPSGKSSSSTSTSSLTALSKRQ
jgi:hypothetical protein